MNAPLVPDPSSRDSTEIAPLAAPAAAVSAAVSVVVSAAVSLLPHPATVVAVIAINIIATITFFIIILLSFMS